MMQRVALVTCAVLAVVSLPAVARAQKALVYCPVSVDATGCNAIATALSTSYALGVDRGYDGTNGTVDLKTVDLFHYSVFIVPSLADNAGAQPYAFLRDAAVVEHLKAALIGRIALWSGSPDQGATNRAGKDALIQNLASYAGGAFATAKGPGLVALLDASSNAGSRYDWVRAIAPLAVTADANLLSYNSVRALNATGTTILTSGAGPITYDNMATFGFAVPNGAPGVSLDAVGQTGTTQGGQVVLVTMEAGNTTQAVVRTDKDDYAPGETVTITGSGWQAGETVRLTLHEDPLLHDDRVLTATADGSGSFTNTQFAPEVHHIGVRFVLTAVGEGSGRRAQTTFTDGTAAVTGTVRSTAAGNPAISGATVTCSTTDGCNQNETTTTDASGVYTLPVNFQGNSATLTIRASAPGFTSASASVSIPNNNVTETQNFLLTPANNAPIANNDSHSTNEDQTLNVTAPGVLGNDTDADNNALTAVLAAGPPAAEGNLTLNANGSFSFTPAPDFNGNTSFTYRASDGTTTSNIATVTITVNAVNDAPTFTLIASHTSNEDTGPQSVTSALTAPSAGPPNESAQTLTLAVSNNNSTLFSAQPAIDASGTLTYTAATDASGTAIITVVLSDNGGTANGGVDATTKTLTITVNGRNDAPSFSKGADQIVNEDAGAQSVPGWATGISAGPADEASQTVSFEITGNTNAALFSAGPAVAPDGTLSYTPAANTFGSATVTLRIKDSGGTADGGIDASAPQSFVITVNTVNDAPAFTLIGNQTVNEDAGAQAVASAVTGATAGPNEGSQALTLTVTNSNTALFSAAPAISLGTGQLTYTPAPDAFGSAIVTVKLSDDGGTANGGVDFTEQTFTITVNSLNDAPSFTKGADQSSLEDAGAQTVANWATNISKGPANESGQTLTFMVTTNNDELFSSLPAINASGQLTYTVAPNASGSALVTVVLNDDGGTANGGDDASDAQTFTITVTPVNDAPTYVKGADPTVNEDAGPQTVPAWATSISKGPSDENGQTLTFNVTANSNASLFSALPSVDPTTGTLTYTPAADAFGTATITLELKDDGGTANGGVDASSQQFVITVNAVNDAPSFTKGADQTVLEDAGAQSVTPWATAISSGPANESGQTVAFSITGNTNPGLFSTAPAVSSSGALTYTPAANASGSATITLVAQDNGGTANGGVDTSAPQTFVITITPVNDAPTYDLIASDMVLEDAGARTVAGALTNASAGPASESEQTLSLTVTNNNNTLFSAQPAINLSTGELTYTPAVNANGTATVTVTLKDDGGTANGGVDQTAKTLTITVKTVNDAPSFVKGANQTSLEDAGARSVAPWATAISAGPPDEGGQILTFVVSNDNPALFSSQPTVSASGELTYTAALNANGSATVTIKVTDNGGTADGGVDTSTDQTFTVTVNAVNDAPDYTLIAGHPSNEDAGAQSVANALTNKSAGPSNESDQTLSLTLTYTNPSLFTVPPAINLSNGELTYTAAPNKNGTATVTVTVKDNGGVANGGIDQRVRSLTITVNPVNDLPVITSFTGSPVPAAVNAIVTASGVFTDVDLGDYPPDEHLVKVDWDDGTAQTTAAQSGSGTSRSFSATHRYSEPGVYTLTVTVTDEATGQDVEVFEYVVVYDPNAGFVTGGGWIDSPMGACLLQTCTNDTIGKANFGFVSKYKKGATVPEGNTEFQFKAGDLNFKSTVYEWLVVANFKALYKGSGTINGGGNYYFMLSAIDGQISGGGGVDKFRIKIWVKNADGTDGPVVYDNQMGGDIEAAPTTALGGGSIVIHSK